MYAQYQYYQHQPSPVETQAQMHWNGSSWVSSSSSLPCSASGSTSSTSVRASSTYTTYQHHPGSISQSHHYGAGGAATTTANPTTSGNANASASKTIPCIPANPVSTYSEYYHTWTKHQQEYEAYRNQLTNPTERAEAQRRIEWAKYYAELSSLAAHYFYENPNATSAPMDLPPAPSIANNNFSTQSYNTGSTEGSKGDSPRTVVTPATTNATDEATPSGLKRYVQKCLQQVSKQEEPAIQREVEKVISKAIQDGTLHSKNWDAEPLIRTATKTPETIVSGWIQRKKPQTRIANPKNPRLTNSTTQNTTKSNLQLAANDSYYGSSGGSGARNSAQGYHGDMVSKSQSDEANYYGPTSSNDNSGRNKSEGGWKSSTNTSYYGPAVHKSQQPPSSPSSSVHSHLSEDSSLLQQKKRKSQEIDFIALSKQYGDAKRKKKWQSKPIKPSMGFERSSSALAKRASRFSGAGGIDDSSASSLSISDSGSDKYMGKGMIGGLRKTLNEVDFEKMTVKGTCTKLEKEYLRLTAPPRAELVRPQPILEQHLENLKAERQSKIKRHDYLWFCSQLKALRQDCTVQRIQNAFTVQVYETHAKIALEEGDLNEFNQCQTQLKELYRDLADNPVATKNANEFVAYRLLYYVFLSTNETYDGGCSDLLNLLLSLTIEQRAHPAISHACQVREAVALGDYHKFFCLHQSSPNLGLHLTSHIVPTIRLRALHRIAKAYRPSVELQFVLKQLGFSNEEEGIKWMKSCGCIILGSSFSTKDSVIHEPKAEIRNSLI